MSRDSATFAALSAVVCLFLVLAACQLQTQDSSAEHPQPGSPDIEATVRAALRSLEEKPPTPVADIGQSTPVTAPVAAPAAAPAVAPLAAAPPDPTHTAPPLVVTPAAISTSPPSPPPPTTATPTPPGAELRPPAPMFAGTFMDGNDYRLEDTVGTPTLLVFWAPW